MTKQEIDAFIAVVKFRTISAAAKELYITQPALSRRIRNLEEEIGYRLFARSKGQREITLTDRGQAFQRIAWKWNLVYQEAAAIQNMEQKPVLRIATIGSVGLHVLPELLRQLVSPKEAFCLDFHLCHSWEAYSLVEGGFADMALIDYLRLLDGQSAGRVISVPVYSTPFVFAGGPAWKGKGKIHPSMLNPSKEIVLPWNTQFDQWHASWFDSKIQPRVRSDHSAVIRSMIQDDLYAIVPQTEGMAIAKENPLVTIHELEDGPPDEMIHCLTTVENQKKPEVMYFRELLRTFLKTKEEVRCYI